MVSDPKIVQYVEELDLLIIRDGGKLYHITGDVITGMWKAYAEGHGIDYDICERCECVDPETVVPLEDYRSMEQTVHKLTQALAEAEPIKHGRWIKITQEWADYAEYFCSCCGRKIKAPFTLNPAWAFPYCHCGAKMDAQEVEE